MIAEAPPGLAENCIPTIVSATSLSPFAQLLSLGMLWTFFHCTPMCGPILTGLNLEAGRGFFLYQLGRAQIYGALGAFAGFLGSSAFADPRLGWGLPVVLFILILVEARPDFFKTVAILPKWAMSLASRAQGYGADRRAYVLGMIFAFLPCGLALWALTLAAATKSPTQGALMMLTLVGMTLVPLLGFQWGMAKLVRGHQKLISLSLLFVSFTWTLLVVLASNGIISHLEVPVTFHGQIYFLHFY